MKIQLLLIAQAGFVLLTVIYLALLLNEVRKAIKLTAWPAEKKKKTLNRILIFLVAWMLFVSLWSGSGIMSDFTKFPFNFMPVMAIPLVSIVIILFSGRSNEIL